MTASIFAAVEMAPRDPILGLTESFNADARSSKVNLGVGVYFDDHGKLPLLAAVKLAENFPIEFLSLTNEISELTGQGSELVKPPAASQPTTA